MNAIDLTNLLAGFAAVSWHQAVMMAVGGVLLYLAIAKEYEPLLLLPIGIGCIFANLPLSFLTGEEGILTLLRRAGIENEVFPLLVFLGVGAMIDFRPLLSQPKFVLIGAAGQFGIYGTLLLAGMLGFELNEAASIAVIGAIDGPTAIYVTNKLAPHLLGPISVVAYSYMSLVPIIQPPIMRLLTTKAERRIKMDYVPRAVSKRAVVLFPIIVTIVIGVLVPQATPLIAMLMLGNLFKESGVVERLSDSAQNEVINVTTMFLGLAVGSTMVAESFLRLETLGILVLGLVAFCLDTAAGLLFGRLMCAISRHKVNPLIGAAGISAFPMSGRVAQRVAQEEDFETFILMHAMGANTAGQLGSVVAGGVLLALVLPLVAG